MIRTNIYKKYKTFKNFEEKPGKLLKQQVFLSTYINDNYDNIDRMLLFHGIGTGKTCTSITIAETIMEKDKKMKALVILPARLKTNFIDELISETCGLNRYISKEDYSMFINPRTPSKDKDKIRERFMKAINVNYEIVSYERLRKVLLDSKDYKYTIEKLTKNRIIIIDEVHNLIASKIPIEVLDKIKASMVIDKKTKSINAVILRLITTLADKSCKLFLLTATPVFDNYGQFIQLVLNLRPDADINKKGLNLGYFINLIKGKVSFYKLKDRSDFPKVITDNIRIKLSRPQEQKILDIGMDDIDDDFSESDTFCMKQRQISISLYDKSKKDIIFKDLKQYAPKLKVLFKLLQQPGKHVIYSNFIQYCLSLIAEYLLSKGWSNYTKTGSKRNKTFVLWDASLNDKEKQEVKSVLNSTNNIDGKIIRVILGSPSIKEGISFKHIQHLHQIDPVWNSSAKEQIEGRCVRFKSHSDIPMDHPTLKREVIIHNYIGVSRMVETCDQLIYDKIMVNKKKVISEIEMLLSKVSVDYYLWTNESSSPQTHSKSSLISASSAEERLKQINVNKGVANKKERNSCPVKRRPVNGNCKTPGYIYIYKNSQGNECCYKKPPPGVKKAIANKPTCPAPRRPVNGRCINLKYPFLRKNTKGENCCFAKEK